MSLRSFLAAVILFVLVTDTAISQTPVPLDSFETLTGWNAVHTHGEGATISLHTDPGPTGNAMCMDFAFSGFMGGVMAWKSFPLTLPKNYQIVFDVKADAPVNNFEIRLVDSAGNVWWDNRLNYEFPKSWTTLKLKKQQFAYAWGPAYGGVIDRLDKIELNISVGEGGKGRVWIDNLRLEPLDEESAHPHIAAVESSAGGTSAKIANGDSSVAGWRSGGKSNAWIELKLRGTPGVGGVVVDWDQRDYPVAYELQASTGGHYESVYSVENGTGGLHYLPIHEIDATALRLVIKTTNRGQGVALRSLTVKGPEFSESWNKVFASIANASPKGWYPKYFHNAISFWTLVGVSGDEKEALMNEQGQIETDRMGFSIEPFLHVNGKFYTWNDARTTPALVDNELPIPSVRWDLPESLSMTVTGVAAGIEDSSALFVRYHVVNSGMHSAAGSFFAALRPFQVDPPWQIFTIVGGTARVDSITCGSSLRVNDRYVVPLTDGASSGCAGFDQGDALRWLEKGKLPPSASVRDRNGHASGAIRYPLNLAPGDSADFILAMPFHGTPARYALSGCSKSDALKRFLGEERSVADFWQARFQHVNISLPPSAMSVVRSLRSNLAYILINRDGAGLQPGSRSYERSWMRDGCMIATALLQLGVKDEVKRYIDWFSRYQRADGFIPCIVDRRGAEAVPENDSHGQYLYMIRQYFEYTADTAWLKSKRENIRRTTSYIMALRRKGGQSKIDPSLDPFAGLVPASISHEGYSAKPMHSYWDNFYCLRGLKDAAEMLSVLGEDSLAQAASMDVIEYRSDIQRSVKLTMKILGITHVPGCVELGDQGGLSNTIIVDPVDEVPLVPMEGLLADFEKFWSEFRGREDGTARWFAYLPYEWRYVNAFTEIGWRQRANELFSTLMRDRRPPQWNHWAEIVWRQPDAADNIGDMPHSWAGSDYIRAVRSMIAFERTSDSTLVLLGGIPDSWATEGDGLRITDLPLPGGTISLRAKATTEGYAVSISGTVPARCRQIIVKNLSNRPVNSVEGTALRWQAADEARITSLPATIIIH
jgi:hypothetical protein